MISIIFAWYKINTLMRQYQRFGERRYIFSILLISTVHSHQMVTFRHKTTDSIQKQNKQKACI